MVTTDFPQPRARAAGLASADATRTRRAVLAGVGEARNRPGAGDDPTIAVALAAEACRAAAQDLGSAAALDSVDLIAMTVGSDDVADPAGALRERLGLETAATMVAAIGVPQQRLVSNAILSVETGAADAVLVVGSEAKASALAAKRSGTDLPEPATGPGADRLLAPQGEFMADSEVSAMLWDPVAQYALIDSALAAVEGRTPRQLRADVSEMWARFDAVAEANPEASFAGTMHTAESLAQPGEDNRLLAFPYNKWHSTQWALDHAVALLICTEEFATRHGCDPDQLLHPQVALDSSFGLTLSRREHLHRWPAMAVMGEVAQEHLGTALSEIELTELYSCFPAAVRLQQRELGLPLDGTPTVLGGMAFAGGPFNHYTYMATAELARRLRTRSSNSDRDEFAMLTTVSGMLTKGGLMVWGRDAHSDGALVADLAVEVESATTKVDIADFDAELELNGETEVIAATLTGGFDPKLFAITADANAVRHIVSTPVPDGDPADALAELLDASD